MTKSHRRYLPSFAGLILAVLLAPGVDAASVTVNSPADSGGSCPGADCTLRQAIAAAASGDTINFAPGLSTINLTSGELLIDKNLTISGPGANLLTVQRSAAPGTAAFHVFHVPAFAAVTISGLLIRNGSPPSGVNGGAVDNLGTLTIIGCTIADSVSAGEFSGGGGIYNNGGDPGGQLTITSSTITGNSTEGGVGGGGILDGGGRVTITNSTISRNSAGSTKGGGIYAAALTITNCTVTGNSSHDGGGIYRSGSIAIKALNSIIAENTAATGPDVLATLSSQGYVLVGDTSGMTLTGFTTGNQLNVDPMLGPLQDNGGPTWTHALLAGSPAIDKGKSGASVVTDQRGFTRPVGMPGVSGGDGSDIGAFEVQGTAGTPTTLGNISTRLRVLSGDNALIGGMIATGSASKKVLIRAIGPTLTDFGVPGALENPTLELFQGSTLITSNDDWRQSPQQAEIQNSGLAPGKDAESAIIATLTPNLGYTAVVRGKDGTTGVGVVEAYDLEQGSPSKLGNISTRGFVDVDDNVMIAGLIVSPSNGTSTKVLVRALGPTLGDFGVPGFLADPTLELVNSSGTVIRSNDNWKTDQRPEIEAANLAPSHDEEAALVNTLSPGAYTAVVRGSGRTTGVGLVEVYNIQ